MNKYGIKSIETYDELVCVLAKTGVLYRSLGSFDIVKANDAHRMFSSGNTTFALQLLVDAHSAWKEQNACSDDDSDPTLNYDNSEMIIESQCGGCTVRANRDMAMPIAIHFKTPTVLNSRILLNLFNAERDMYLVADMNMNEVYLGSWSADRFMYHLMLDIIRKTGEQE